MFFRQGFFNFNIHVHGICICLPKFSCCPGVSFLSIYTSNYNRKQQTGKLFRGIDICRVERQINLDYYSKIVIESEKFFNKFSLHARLCFFSDSESYPGPIKKMYSWQIDGEPPREQEINRIILDKIHFTKYCYFLFNVTWKRATFRDYFNHTKPGIGQ